MAIKIAVLHGPGASASARDILLACGGEYHPVFLVSPGSREGERLAGMLSKVAEVTVADRREWAAAAEDAGAVGATTFVDQYVPDLEDVVRALGLRGATAEGGCWDKLAQRELLNAAGASCAPVLPVASLEEFASARSIIGPAGILKPRRSSTGRGIRVVSAGEQTSAVWAELISRHGMARMPGYVYEQLMDGAGGDGWLAPYVSVDTVSRGTERIHFGLFDKLPLLREFIETGHVGPSGVAPEARAEILATASRALDALGVADRITHTEVRLTSAGPQVIEVNGRLGGYVQGLSESLTGANPVRMALDAAAGASPAVPPLPDPQSVSHAVAAVVLPLDTGSPVLARHATWMLRSHPLVKSVEVPAPVDSTLSYAGAWLEARSREGLFTAIATTITDVCADPAVREAVDTTWLRLVTTPPPRLTSDRDRRHRCRG
jgi:hypothetical protein